MSDNMCHDRMLNGCSKQCQGEETRTLEERRWKRTMARSSTITRGVLFIR